MFFICFHCLHFPCSHGHTQVVPPPSDADRKIAKADTTDDKNRTTHHPPHGPSSSTVATTTVTSSSSAVTTATSAVMSVNSSSGASGNPGKVSAAAASMVRRTSFLVKPSVLIFYRFVDNSKLLFVNVVILFISSFCLVHFE